MVVVLLVRQIVWMKVRRLSANSLNSGGATILLLPSKNVYFFIQLAGYIAHWEVASLQLSGEKSKAHNHHIAH